MAVGRGTSAVAAPMASPESWFYSRIRSLSDSMAAAAVPAPLAVRDVSNFAAAHQLLRTALADKVGNGVYG